MHKLKLDTKYKHDILKNKKWGRGAAAPVQGGLGVGGKILPLTSNLNHY